MTCCYRFGVSLRKLLGLHFFGDPLDDDATSLDLERLTPPIAVTLRKRRHKQTLTFVLISDTHMTHEAMVVPEGDVLLHAGDFGKWNSSRDDVMRFNAWLGRLPHPVKLITGGNHDRLGLDFYRAIFTNATFLANEAVFIAVARDGSVSVRSVADADDACDLIKVHAHPQTPARSFVYRANGFSAPLAEREALCAAIADDTDVLLSHAPPCGVLDDVGDTLEGCAALRRRVLQFNPALHVFGHCHNHGGVCVRAAGGTTFVNAAQAYAAPVVVRVRLVKK